MSYTVAANYLPCFTQASTGDRFVLIKKQAGFSTTIVSCHVNLLFFVPEGILLFLRISLQLDQIGYLIV